MTSQKYTYWQKINQKSEIYHNYYKNENFIYHRFNKKGIFDGYWLYDSPINQNNYIQRFYNYIFTEENFCLYVIKSEKWINS